MSLELEKKNFHTRLWVELTGSLPHLPSHLAMRAKEALQKTETFLEGAFGSTKNAPMDASFEVLLIKLKNEFSIESTSSMQSAAQRLTVMQTIIVKLLKKLESSETLTHEEIEALTKDLELIKNEMNDLASTLVSEVNEKKRFAALIDELLAAKGGSLPPLQLQALMKERDELLKRLDQHQERMKSVLRDLGATRETLRKMRVENLALKRKLETS